MAELTGISREQAAEALRRHLGLCYDVCHAAVEFEDPGSSIDALRRAAIPVHKLQLSAAIRVEKVDGGAREALGAYAEPTYLHQVVSNDGHSLSRISDLPEALSRGAAADGEEWRIHFHVPIFVEHLDHFGTTQGFLADVLALHRQEAISPHLEVETYTWGVLPEKLRAETMEQAITRELTWVLDRLQ